MARTSGDGGVILTIDELRALIPADWRTGMERTLATADLARLAMRLSNEPRTILPTERKHWFRALALTPATGVRAVIIGQDPYPRAEHAEGLAFSVPNMAKRVPPSLVRILSAAREVATIFPGHASLIPWAERGVLLLNTSLTVPEGMAGGHRGAGWRPVTDAILHAVARQTRPVVFMPWGVEARAAIRRVGIEDGRPHIVCPSVHPMERRGTFMNSHPFALVNNRLGLLGLDPIDWSLDRGYARPRPGAIIAPGTDQEGTA